ncbi:M48 family metallopeptidase [bacterium]|nr:M48 family metallopeptidase [bacterium]
MKKKFLCLSVLVSFGFISCGEGPRPQNSYSYSDQNGSVTNQQSQENRKKIKNKEGVRLTNYKTNGYNLYAVDTDIKIGEMVQEQQMKEFKRKKVAIDPPEYAAVKTRIENIVKKIATVSDKPNFPYEVHIYDKPDVVNAYCLPGGKIGVFTGLFSKDKGLINPANDDELAAVLGHEIAHATQRHVTRRASTMQSFGILGAIASVAVGQTVGGEWQQGFDQMVSLGVNLTMPSYSRKFEREADQVGFYYMTKAGYKPEAAIDVWKRAASRKDGKDYNFFSSHPSNGERASNLEGWLAEAHDIQNNQKIIEGVKK